MSQTTFSRTLQAWRAGDAEAADELARLVYRELHRIARHLLRQEQYAHSLTPTVLINETWLRLFGREMEDATQSVEITNRQHFFLLAARQMRQLLIDRARRATAQKRIRQVDLVPLEEMADIPVESDRELLALNDALDELENVSPRACRAVELRFFAGLDEAETARILGISEVTLRRDWKAARLWLYDKLKNPPAAEQPS